MHEASAVEQYVGLGSLDSHRDARIVEDVDAEGLDVRVVQFGESGLVDVSCEHQCAFVSHGQGRCPSNALTGSGDQNTLPLKSPCWHCPFSRHRCSDQRGAATILPEDQDYWTAFEKARVVTQTYEVFREEIALLKVLVTGGGGMIGQKLAAHLGKDGLNGNLDLKVTLADIGFPGNGASGERKTVDLAVSGTMRRLAADSPDVIFHLASVVSGEAEQDYAKGWNTNMLPMWELLEALRERHEESGGKYVPRIVFASSLAVFGGPFPDRIGDEFLAAPQTSCGAQKAVCELMIGDASRKGWIDGISIRLPTICVRPGRPNRAASGFFSGIVREPLNGEEAVLPVEDTVRHWLASPRAAVGFLLHAAELDTSELGGRRWLNMPGFSCTVAEQIEALGRVAGSGVVRLIRREPDPAIMQIVSTWPRDFEPTRALALGFQAERDFDRIIEIYMEDELKSG